MIVFIPGASSAFGEVTARKFVGDGAKVIGTGRRKDRLEKLRGTLGEAFHPLVFDVGQEVRWNKRSQIYPPEFAAVDVVVNNAGGAAGLDPAQRAQLDDWDAMVDSNVKGVMYCTRLLLPGIIERAAATSSTLSRLLSHSPRTARNLC